MGLVLTDCTSTARRLSRRAGRVLLAVTAAGLVAVGVAGPAHATWSLVAADDQTGQVGAAIASCVDITPAETYTVDDGSLLMLAVVPGAGAGITQAQLNLDAPDVIRQRLTEGASADQIVTELTDPTFDEQFNDRQHAVITLANPDAPVAFTGSGDLPWAGAASGPGVSAQGNTLVSSAVTSDAVDAYLAADGPMDSRLVAGLLAGSTAGGDDRCGDQTALFAHVAVSAPDGSLNVHTVTVTEGDGRNPVQLLADEVNAANATTSGQGEPETAAQETADQETAAQETAVEESAGGSSLMLVRAAVGIGLLLAVAGGVWLVRRSRRGRTMS